MYVLMWGKKGHDAKSGYLDSGYVYISLDASICCCTQCPCSDVLMESKWGQKIFCQFSRGKGEAD